MNWVIGVRLIGLLSMVLLLACSPVGSTVGSHKNLASFSQGCETSGSYKVAASKSTQVTIKKWNFNIASPEDVVVSSKTQTSVPLGAKVSIAIDNQCMSQNAAGELEKVLLSNSELQKKWNRNLPRSYITFQLDKTWDLEDLKSVVETAECILTFEEAKTLKLASFPSDSSVGMQPFWQKLSYPQVFDSLFNTITEDVTVAVIDSGIDLDHQDLSTAIWTNTGEIPGNGLDDDGNGYADDIHGYHFVNNDGDPDPDSQFSVYNLHGTAVAGLIGAVENGVGVIGVMPSHVKLMSLNVFGESASSEVEDVAEAIEYAVANGASVINLSLAGKANSTLIQTALTKAASAGVVVVVAAGNDGVKITASNFYAPAGYAKDIQGVIAVGATVADSNRVAPYSNFNSEYVEMAAPGSYSIIGSPTGLYTLEVDDGYGYYDGTSFSAPLISGAAALTIAWLKSHGTTPTAAEVEGYLKGASLQVSNLKGLVQDCRVLNFEKLQQRLSQIQ